MILGSYKIKTTFKNCSKTTRRNQTQNRNSINTIKNSMKSLITPKLHAVIARSNLMTI